MKDGLEMSREAKVEGNPEVLNTKRTREKVHLQVNLPLFLTFLSFHSQPSAVWMASIVVDQLSPLSLSV